MKNLTILLFVMLSAVGCASQAGPFVTSISSDGNGGVIVEKCMANFDPMMSTMHNASCTSTLIKLSK